MFQIFLLKIIRKSLLELLRQPLFDDIRLLICADGDTSLQAIWDDFPLSFAGSFRDLAHVLKNIGSALFDGKTYVSFFFSKNYLALLKPDIFTEGIISSLAESQIPWEMEESRHNQREIVSRYQKLFVPCRQIRYRKWYVFFYFYKFIFHSSHIWSDLRMGRRSGSRTILDFTNASMWSAWLLPSECRLP